MVAADYEGQAHISFMPWAEFARFNVIARMGTEAAAQAAVCELQRAGVAVSDAAVLGAPDDAVHTGTGLTELDERLVRGVVRDACEGALAGGVGGGAFGLLISALPPLAGGVAAAAAGHVLAAVFGATVGIIAGGLVGGVAGLDRSQAGSNPYDDQIAQAQCVVGVHVADAEQQRQICELLQRNGAYHLRAFADGEEPTL